MLYPLSYGGTASRQTLRLSLPGRGRLITTPGGGKGRCPHEAYGTATRRERRCGRPAGQRRVSSPPPPRRAGRGRRRRPVRPHRQRRARSHAHTDGRPGNEDDLAVDGAFELRVTCHAAGIRLRGAANTKLCGRFPGDNTERDRVVGECEAFAQATNRVIHELDEARILGAAGLNEELLA